MCLAKEDYAWWCAPLTKHYRQPVDAPRSLVAGRPLGFSCGLFQAKGDWAWYQQVFVFHRGMAQGYETYICKPAYDDILPYVGLRHGCKLEGQAAQTWNLCQGPEACNIKCQPMVDLPEFCLGHGAY